MKKINAILGLAIILLAVGNVMAEENSTSMPVIDMYYIDYTLADVTRQNCNQSNYDKINGLLSNLSNNMSWWGLDNVSNKTRQVIQLYVWLTQGLYGDTCTLQSNFYNLNKTLTEKINSREQQLSWLSDAYLNSINKTQVIVAYSDLTLKDENNRLTLENQKLKRISAFHYNISVFLMLVIIVLVGWMVYSYYIRKDIKKIKGEIIK